MDDEFVVARKNMVRYQIRERGIRDRRVLRAMERVARHEFVPKEMMDEAYRDEPLPIGEGQTISQPYMVALMTACLELKGDEKVLEVGTGSGYQAAVLSVLAREVVSLEIKKGLADRARRALSGYRNVRVVEGDGYFGYEVGAPYDRIIVTAAALDVPVALFEQLAEGGILVVPVGGSFVQELLRFRKVHGEFFEEYVSACVFVPLVRTA